MELTKAITERSSVRGYLEKTVSRDVLEQVLALATRAISGHNYQPWEISVVTGEKLAELAKANIESFRSGNLGTGLGDTREEPYLSRGRVIGRALFSAMQIGREDKEKRAEWNERGFRFFGAPALFVICLDSRIDDKGRWLDIGALVQNICLAAKEFGLDTCVEFQATNYPENVRKVLGIAEDKNPVVGVAIGYKDPEFAANSVVSERQPLEEVTTWFGF